MENHHTYHQNKIEKLHQQDHHQSTQCKSQPPPPPSTTASPPPSSSSSPAHEFSFTISLHNHQPPFSTAKPPPPSTALDLSPADDIFFHGHLLPLHLLSHLPPSSSSPRSSTNSLDNFTLPINQDHQFPTEPIRAETQKPKSKPKPRPKSFSLFGIPIRRKGDYYSEERETEEREKQRKKLKFDLSQVLKRYMRMVRPLFNGKRRERDLHMRRQPYSFSGYLSPRDYYYEEETVRRGEFSAPASMKTSPSNSGLLVSPSTSDSTMEELQAAIQAAIAHCKNSIAVEEKINKC